MFIAFLFFIQYIVAGCDIIEVIDSLGLQQCDPQNNELKQNSNLFFCPFNNYSFVHGYSLFLKVDSPLAGKTTNK